MEPRGLLIILVIAGAASCASALGFAYGVCDGCDPGTCCRAYLMDNRGGLLIDNSTRVGPGTLYGLQFHLCENVSVTVSLWSHVPGSPDSSPIYEESPYVVQYPGVGNSWKTKVVDGETWVYTTLPQPWALDRPYVVGIRTTHDRLPIPYGGSAGARSPLLEEVGRDTNGLARVMTRRLDYFRTFGSFIVFCTSPEGCPEEEGCTAGCRGRTGARGPAGPAGPPGPPGPPGAGLGLACDTPEFGTTLNDIGSRTKALQDQLAKVESALQKVRSDRETGICPVDFLSGSYGLGYCYHYTAPTDTNPRGFGESALRCAGTEDSRLVDIENEAEELYLAETVVSMFEPRETNRTFWTAGLYSEKFGGWVWYDERLATRKTLFYQNWAAGEPRETNPFKKCLVLRIFSDKTSDWVVENCNSRHQFICKKAKKCF